METHEKTTTNKGNAIERSQSYHSEVFFSIIFPTFNESENVVPLLRELSTHLQSVEYPYEILFIDDSKDNTPEVIRAYMEHEPNITLIHRKNNTGLATAFAEGFEEARGDYVICMDSDLQHPPEAVPRMMRQVELTQSDIVVGTRYRKGGHADGLGGTYRKAVSHLCRFFSWTFLSATRKSSDPGAGFFAIRRSMATSIDPANLRGFKILIEILVQKKNATVSEIVYGFRKREGNDSKATMKQGINYLLQVVDLWGTYYVKPVYAKHFRQRLHLLYAIMLVAAVIYAGYFISGLVEGTLAKVVFTVSMFLSLQGLFAVILHLYTWNNPLKHFAQERYLPHEVPTYSFTAMIPAREEVDVLKATIRGVSDIDYPDHLKETFVLVYADDDPDTIQAAKEAIAEIGKSNVQLVDFGGAPGPSKSRALNIGLARSTKDIITIFDAEDRVQPGLYNAMNTIFIRKGVDVVQSGVQLMNYHTSWYSMFNVLEYYFWFKSALHFFASRGVVPLGGNTVFMKRDMVRDVGGWDAGCLTEDADIGIRLAAKGAKFDIFYNEELSTQEQTPPTIASFVKQRTRWNQGFMQILRKGEWLQLEKFSQKVLIVYVLAWPFMQAALVFFLPLSVVAAFFIKIPIVYSLLAFIPLYVLIAIVVISCLAIYEFAKTYKTKFNALYFAKIIVMIIPFQLLLGVSAFRAIVRNLSGKLNWEKTEHLNIDYSVTNNS